MLKQPYTMSTLKPMAMACSSRGLFPHGGSCYSRNLAAQHTPAVEAAWAAAYTLLADTMQAAAAESAYGAEAMQTATSAEG